MWDKILKFYTDNKDFLDLLLGSGVIFVVLGGIVTFTRWLLKEYRLRRIRTNDNFPFKIIPPNSNVAKEILGGADDDPLADRNIPYQQRIQGRNTRRELEELIEDNRWILITGRTGLGKTREAVQLSQSLNNEGWTILYLTREAWLDAPAKLPNNIPERKLLFFLDDLNKKCFSSKAEIRPDASESLTRPVHELFQTRLQRTLEAFDTFCGKSEIRVIATARNEKTSEFDEPSEWDKLGWAKYKNLWEEFKLVDLPEPEQVAEEKLLAETSERAGIPIKSNELQGFVKRNDGTFRNLVENLLSAKTEGSVLSSENFRETLKGTWQKRYQKAIQKFPEAKNLYDAIELLQEVGITLKFSTVMQVAKIVSEERFSKQMKLKRKYSSALKSLIKTENILHPRDGQIEAKGYRINTEKHLPKLYKQIFFSYFETYYPSLKDSNFILRLFAYPMFYLAPKSLFRASTRHGRLERVLFSLLTLDISAFFMGSAYARLGFMNIAQQLLQKSVEIQTTNPINRILFRSAIGISWRRLGDVYFELNQYEDAVTAYNKAIKFYPKSSSNWSELGIIYYSKGQNDDAINSYQKAIELDSQDYVMWGNLGIIYLNQRKIDLAINALKKSLEINPNYTYSILSLALCCKTIGENADAEKLIDSANRLIENDIEYSQACFHIAKGNVNRGLHLIQLGIQKQQTSRIWAQKDPNFWIINENPEFRRIVGLNS